MIIQAILAFVGLVFGILCYVSYAASRVEINRYPRKYDQ